MIFTQHLLLGLIGEDHDPNGFLESDLKIKNAREAVRSIWQSNNLYSGEDSSNKEQGSMISSMDAPFSISTKRVFEAVVEFSRTMGYNFIAPEHIVTGLFTVDDGSAGRVLRRLGANINHLAAAAVTRLQGELAKDGREPSLSSKNMGEKPLSGNAAGLRTPLSRKKT